jgi:glycosyltransferase involved in cell wall biosynthesis
MSSQKKGDYLIYHPQKHELIAHVINLNILPVVSFCIPTKNNEDTLEKCLQSIVDQNYPKIEIIIVDGYSSDTTINIAKKFTDKIFFEKGLLGSARQKSIELANGPIIALFDSDIQIPHKNWLINAVSFFNYDETVSTIWPICVAPPDSTKFAKLYQTNFFKLVIESRINKGISYFGGGNALFLKKYIDEIGGVNKQLHWGEDFDWAKKLKEYGYNVVFLQDPLYHDTMRTVKEFYKKQFVGAETFTQTGFGMMGLTMKDIFYENFYLGFKGMFRGLIIERDMSWLYYPVFLVIRILAYSSLFIKKTLSRQSGA